jgi:nucleoside-diphosphate-sugar epimerase
VTRALERGHRVRALTRRAEVAANPPQSHERLQWQSAAPGDVETLATTLAECDVVIHLAAAKSGSLNTQMNGTVDATNRVLEAMDRAGTRRLVLVGSFSVYDYMALPPGAELNEKSPLESRPERRDAYTRAKLLQEQRVTDHARTRGGNWSCHILRAGAIYGNGQLWTARLGTRLGNRVWVRIGGDAALPLVHVENCADAVVLAAERDAPGVHVLNIVDDNPPTQSEYARAARSRLRPRPLVLAVPRGAVRFLAGAVDRLNRALCGGHAHVPGLLVPARFDARFKPLHYSNTHAKETLGWTPRHTLKETLERG